jgi:hypothetical protein
MSASTRRSAESRRSAIGQLRSRLICALVGRSTEVRLCSKADVNLATVTDHHGPFSDSSPAAKCIYSITSSARTRPNEGIFNPSALAALLLTISSSLVGNSTGRSPGLAPLRILFT